ncbi:hypothetical protein F1654_08645 [Alkalicaulis satelles]|uniref:Trimeric autotransporter adhesin YadA-like head domain-containing protein n=1 Tax=Alkalicaulis satelles TaxID=2609175 RepID=A0A5M6ZGI3_9PROT|nr:YadA-like family protein [Alkalicaulis satelles]KAA5803856.1 hypothetical protein F1654_08645 [Alkalicaulis satelles]
MPNVFKSRGAQARRIKWAVLTTTALLPLALAAEAAGQTPRECPDGTTGPGEQDGTGNAACQTTASAYGQFNLASGGSSSAFGRSNTASGGGSSAFGISNIASGSGSSAFGRLNIASGFTSSAFGNDSTASGGFASAFGWGNTASGNSSIAVGTGNTASGAQSSAFGFRSITDPGADGALAVGGWYDRNGNTAVNAATELTFALGRYSAAVGSGVRAEGEASSAFGVGSTAEGDFASAFGFLNTAGGDNSVAFGYENTTGANFSSAVGYTNTASGEESHALGGFNEAQGFQSSAVGYFNIASGLQGSAFGAFSQASGDRSSAFGYGSIASAEGATAIGFEAVADRAFTVAIGSLGNERNLIHVADGVEDTDAVNLRQVTGLTDALDARITANTDGLGVLGTDLGALDGRVTTAESEIAALQGQISTGSVGLVLQAGADAVVTVAAATGGAAVDFTGADGARTLSGVAEGDVSASSDEAVTGAQLFAANAAISSNSTGIELANQRLADSLGAGAAFDAGTGLFTGPSFVVMGNPYDNVGGAIGALNTQVVENTADIADLKSTGAGGGGTGGSGDPAQDARIAALEAQLAALQGALQTASDQLAAIQQGNVIGGTVTDSTNLAAGDGSQATGHGDTAYGVGASATGDPSTAIGFQAQASGQHSTAIGGNAQATGDLSVALGQASGANATALGQGAAASGANSTAVGQGASAAFDNAIAIGQGVAATRDNQVAIGSGSNTYTLAGINSAASRAAQTGRTYMVTADAMGNLATMDIEPWFARIEGLEDSVSRTDGRLRTQADGIAVSLALGGAQVIQPGQTFSVSANLGHFDGSSAVGFGAIGRARENVFVNVGIGAGSRTGAVAGRAGISWGW